MAEITKKDLLIEIKKMTKDLEELTNARVESTGTGNLDSRVTDLESELKILREEMNQNFRKLEEKIS